MTPASVLRAAVRPGAYHDSVMLMRLQAALAGLPGVLDAGVVMATPANRELLAAGGLLTEGVAAGPDDLLIVVRAADEATAADALARVDPLLAERRAGSGAAGFRPRSVASALKLLPAARWVLVSVAGRHAAAVAREALDLGRNVFLYSDNVPLAEEVALKETARERGLLVLGPDCGTAIVGGVGLGFANRVRRGGIGLVGASGTGLQMVASHVHDLGGGISQAVGTGGRDLQAEVGGTTAAQALDLLRRDPETAVIVLLGKPPAPEVTVRLLALLRSTGKPSVVHLLGAPLPGRRQGDVHFAAGLAEAAELAVALAADAADAADVADTVRPHPAIAEPGPLRLAPGQRYLRGLFSGGTLAAEALLGLQAGLGPLWSNVSIPSLPAIQRLPDPLASRAHTVLDLGDDTFTVGRLHPMIDHDLRRRRLRQEAADPEVAVLLLDVVLGEGAHPDPAGELAPAIAQARAEASAVGRDLAVLAVVVGTEEDPQNLPLQVERLAAAGARVFRTVDAAVVAAVALLGEPGRLDGPPVPLEAVRPPLAAVNVGLESFFESLVTQGAQAVQVDWRPPAGGNEKLAGILARMKKSG
ncbi:MAG TPA: acyl-CoA synthetase FdrA [Thermoanaerobaculia bacterium]|nr:acyl-CoA synthetase FdrA [Thermoanaerobaculia bacterium]